jgi:hypothetical protein
MALKLIAMQTKILDLVKTDHELYKQWSYGISDPKMVPVVSKIEAPKGNQKKIVFVLPSFLQSHGLGRGKNLIMVLVLRGYHIVTLYFCDHPNSLLRNEKDAEFQMIY